MKSTIFRAVASLVIGTTAVAAPSHDDHDHEEPVKKVASTRPGSATPPAEHSDHDDHHHDHDHDDHDHASPSKAAPDSHGHDHDDGHGHGGHADEVRLTPQAVERHGIRLATAEKRVLAQSFVAPGRVAFNTETMAHVGAPVRGRVVEIKARLGDSVAKGDELLVVESPELGQAQSEFLQRRAAVTVAETAVAPARQSYDRAKALHEKNEGVALAEVQRREAAVAVAEAALATARSAVTAGENTLRLMGMDDASIKALAQTDRLAPRYPVRAPLAGTVIEREITIGELVAPDKEALMVLADPSSVWVLADVPEVHLPDVRRGADARVRIAATQNVIAGKVSNVSASLDPNTRTGRVRVEVPNTGGLLRPGMFARVEIRTAADGHQAELAVPEEAVQSVEGKTVVFVPVEGEANTFAVRPVSVGPPVGGYVPVREGLREGDRYVATGTFILKADLGKSGAGHQH